MADVNGQASQAEVSKAVDFTFKAVQRKSLEEREVVLEKLKAVSDGTFAPNDKQAQEWVGVVKDAFSTDEDRVLKMVKNVFADYFSVDEHGGLVANLEKGNLGLVQLTSEDHTTTNQTTVEPSTGVTAAQKEVSVIGWSCSQLRCPWVSDNNR